MTTRALVLSVEAYPKLAEAGLTPDLPGTLDAARAWIAAVRAAFPDVELLWCSTPKPPEADAEATLPEIRRALEAKLRGPTGWRVGTERLLVFCAGHGLAAEGHGTFELLDTLVTAEHERMDAPALLPVGWLQTQLAGALGPGRHHWFLDICRNPVTGVEVPLLPPLVARPHDQPAGVSEVWATRPHTQAATESGFGPAVAAALRGRGRGWYDAKLVVDRVTVARWVQRETGVPSQDCISGGDDDARVIREYRPPPRAELTVDAPTEVTLLCTSRVRGSEIQQTVKPRGKLSVPPDDYVFSVTATDGSPVHLQGPATDHLDLTGSDFEPTPTATLTVVPGPPPGGGLESLLGRVDRFRELRATPSGEAWLNASGLATETHGEPHLSEAFGVWTEPDGRVLEALPVDLEDLGDTLTLAAAAAQLGGGFGRLDEARFPPTPAVPGVFVVLSLMTEHLRPAGGRVELTTVEGAPFADTHLTRVPAVEAHAAFVPTADAPASARPDLVRLAMRTPDGYTRAVLLPVAPDGVTVVTVVDYPSWSDQRLVVLPAGRSTDWAKKRDVLRLAAIQLITQRAGRLGGARDVPPLEPGPWSERVREVHGAFARAAFRKGARVQPPHVYDEDPLWLLSWWTERAARDPGGVAPLVPPGASLRYRSPFTTWRLPNP